LPLHLILSLPNNLLAHVPITEISSTLTKLLSAEQDAMSVEGESEDEDKEDDEDKSAPELGQLFAPGQYFTAKVLNLFPTASQSFISQYPVTETTRLAARLEATLVPEKVNAEVVKADLGKGYVLLGEVKEEEDKGWRVGLGLGEDAKDVEGWLSLADVKKHAGCTSFPSLIHCRSKNYVDK
jgi:rRNA biogenesis protein RRP5